MRGLVIAAPRWAAAHWGSYKDQNWFAKRVAISLRRLRRMLRSLFADTGFSLPYLNADPRFRDRTDIRSLLDDKYTNGSSDNATLLNAFGDRLGRSHEGQ